MTRAKLNPAAMHTLILSLGLWIFSFSSASMGSTDDLKGKLVITGASTIAPLALEIGKRFEKLHPDVRVDVQTGGSSRGVNDARQGLADIGLVSRQLHENERDLAAAPIALDGVAVILHKENPVRSLSQQQIVGIYRGDIKNWKEVGGKDAAITVVNKAEGRSTLEIFAKHFGLKNSEIKAHIIIGDNEQGIKTVAKNAHAIGYVSIGTAEYNVEQGLPLRLLPLDGIEATAANVKAGKYPLMRPLTLATKPQPSKLVQAFLEYAKSGQVQDLIKEQYFVAVEQK